jgi:hypothetical protein
MKYSETIQSAVQKLTSLLDCRCDIPPEHSLTEYDMALLWLRMHQQGMDKYIFCSGETNTYEDFKKLIKADSIWVYAGFSKVDGEPVALAFLDNFIGKNARLHYTFFRNPESMANKERYAEAFFDLLFANRTLDSLMLTTPSIFRHSNAFARAVGADFLGAVPSLIPVKNFKTGDITFPLCNVYVKTSPYYTSQKGCD